jgi:hypothetical protein
MDPNNNGKEGKVDLKAPVLNPEDVTMEVRIPHQRREGGLTGLQHSGFLRI